MNILTTKNLTAHVGILSFLLLGNILSPVAVQAAEQQSRDRIMFQAPPSVQQMGDHLFPAATRTRGIVFNQNDKPAQPDKKSIGLPVLFHFGKTSLVNASKQYLDKIGELMQAPKYANETLVIEGHTDAVGSDTFNYRLSELRALAVKDYLVARYSIDPLRLFPVGQGERMLIDENAPNGDINRRVEFLRYDR